MFILSFPPKLASAISKTLLSRTPSSLVHTLGMLCAQSLAGSGFTLNTAVRRSWTTLSWVFLPASLISLILASASLSASSSACLLPCVCYLNEREWSAVKPINHQRLFLGPMLDSHLRSACPFFHIDRDGKREPCRCRDIRISHLSLKLLELGLLLRAVRFYFLLGLIASFSHSLCADYL